MIARIEQPWKAISVHAPWAWALMYAGKDVENRAKSFPRRRDGREVIGRVWIHASKWPGRDPSPGDFGTVAYDDFMAECRAVAGVIRNAVPVELMASMRGHIVGSVEVYGYQMPEPHPPKSHWYVPGSLAIMVRDPQPLATPVPEKGALGWWTPSDEVLAELGRVQL